MSKIYYYLNAVIIYQQIPIVRVFYLLSFIQIFFSENISALGDSSVFQDKSEHSETTSDSKKPISLFDNDFDSSTDADDLFSSISKKDNVPKLSDKRLSLFDNINNVLEENVKRENPDPIEEEDPVKDSTKSEEPPKEAGEIDLSTGSTTSGKETKKPPTGK